MKNRIILAIILLCAAAAPALAQNGAIRGSVKGSDGDILSGATLVAQSGKYAIADADGAWTLLAKEGETVTVSFFGYDEQTFTVGKQAVYDIVLQLSAATMLDETVIIGYGKTTKREVTGSVASLKAEDLDKGSFTTAAQMLQGKVAGLTVTNPNGGDPNASYEILLRGTNTLKAGQGPLIIIDGVADADIRNINFQEVESVDVLKDGSAAAIYGTRGSNGVLIITTKRAKAGTTVVEYDGQASVQTVASRAVPMTAEQFKHAITTYAPSQTASIFTGDTDWFKEITRTPFSHKHSLAVSGGSPDFSHRTVLNVEQNQGLQKRNDAQKYLFKTNIHQKAVDGWLDLDYNLGYVKRSYVSSNTSAFRQAFLHNPTEPVYDPNNTTYGGYYTITAMDYMNPVAMLNEYTNNRETNYITANVRATLNVLSIPGLKWDNFVTYNTELYQSQKYSTRYDPGEIGKNGVAEVSNETSRDFQWESTVQYSQVFGSHSIQAVAGYTWQRSDYYEMYGKNYGFETDFYKTNNLGIGSALKQGLAGMGSSRSSSRYIAFFGRVMYNYQEKYLASVSLRRDGSTRFGKDHKWGWFPAVSLGWRINQEEWMKGLNWLSDLKLRAGFGVTGNQDFSNYKSLMLMKSSTMFFYNGEWINSYAPASNENPNLGWERKNEFNVGVDFAFLDNRIGGTLDYYYRLTTDLLYDYSVPVPPYDYDTIFTNVGSISNKGLELTLFGTPVKKKDLEWNVNFTAAGNRNKLIKFKNEEFKGAEYKVARINSPIDVYSQRLVEGESLGQFYAPIFDHVDPVTGRDVLKDEIAGGVVEPRWSRIGTAYPFATLGLGNSVRWKNLSVSCSLRAALGGKVFNSYRAFYENINYIGLKNILASWLDDPTFLGAITYSTKYIEDATYLKLDNLTVSYNIKPEQSLVKNIRLYLTGQNLLCLTGYKGVDPEVSLSGLAPGIEGTSYYPRTRVFTLGVNVTL
ncbi:MAG: SusC/RagA family TonB-linked outer membrane protein [Bacteroidales bacterium]|nr:SusC/RagA family TonB-linked outer membrane protein [Bacteroidales bacterium]